MLFSTDQIETELKRIEEIPDTFFANIAANEDFGYDLLPDWFEEEYGHLKARGLYKKALDFFVAIKNSGRENDIIDGYEVAKNIQDHCSNSASVLFYLESINQNVFDTAKVFFNGLFQSFGKEWFEDFSRTNVLEYLKDYKRRNDVFLCPICGNETLKSTKYEARGALDHWFCKAKYPLTAVHWANLTPLGEGCNRSPIKGENEIVWTGNDKLLRQTFLYPFDYNGEMDIELLCHKEPSNGINDFGKWEFVFIGQDANHQDLIDKWNLFFSINKRWVDETLLEFVETWTTSFSKYIMNEGNGENLENTYDQLLQSYCNSKVEFNLIPGTRIHWFFLNFLLNGASFPLYQGYKEEVKNLVSKLING